MDSTLPHSIANDDGSLMTLAASLGERLQARGLRMATAESCTGGWIAKVLTDVAGSSSWFDGGLVTYSNALKEALLGVPPALLRNDGAVSAPVVAAMALGACERTGCEVTVAVSGVAGPDGGTADKPVGLVWFGFCLAGQHWAQSQHFAGTREVVRRATVGFALRRLTQQFDN